EVIDWFKNHLKPLVTVNTSLRRIVTAMIDKGVIHKTDITTIVKRADFNISDIHFQKEETELSDSLFSFLKSELKSSSKQIKELEENRKITSVNIQFEHTVNNIKYNLPIDYESQGTKKYYDLAELLTILIKNSVVFPIDELEASLHPDLYLHYLLSFLMNSKKSQIIATTHNREILDNKDVFRNDAIWFAN